MARADATGGGAADKQGWPVSILPVLSCFLPQQWNRPCSMSLALHSRLIACMLDRPCCIIIAFII